KKQLNQKPFSKLLPTLPILTIPTSPPHNIPLFLPYFLTLTITNLLITFFLFLILIFFFLFTPQKLPNIPRLGQVVQRFGPSIVP
ncbi:cadmium resistance transporter, partial [Staphylococcus epidermidis]|uniref:cadmium resistance transporter n=1 Tax=Staphylococcus epidermidis TaxID=1282 RepID=UPI001642AF13